MEIAMKMTLATLDMALIGLVSVVMASSGCQKDMRVATGASAEASAETTPMADPTEAGVVTESPGSGGAQLWSQNCMRCHNLRPPDERSDREWEIIVHHMRVRGNLTAKEHRLILAFLKSAN